MEKEVLVTIPVRSESVAEVYVSSAFFTSLEQSETAVVIAHVTSVLQLACTSGQSTLQR